ncbi:MAG TPA: hypothetical protein VHB47_10955 [Thermoanaerobaculia bacterium]|nr:hypothetical protein [Thermoanaerobaculia bacterium]
MGRDAPANGVVPPAGEWSLTRLGERPLPEACGSRPPPLEQLVEVAAYADRRLAASRGRRRKGEPPPRGEVTPKPVPNGRQQV